MLLCCTFGKFDSSSYLSVFYFSHIFIAAVECFLQFSELKGRNQQWWLGHSILSCAKHNVNGGQILFVVVTVVVFWTLGMEQLDPWSNAHLEAHVGRTVHL